MRRINKGEFHIRITPHLLKVYQLIEFAVGKSLDSVLRKIEILRRKVDYGIELPAASDSVREVFVVLPDEILLESPALFCGIVHSRFGRYLGHKLIVLDHGRLAEFGTHKELLDKKGIYYHLVMAQRKAALEKQ